MTERSWYTSKIVWLGVITTLLGVLPLIDELVKQSPITPSSIIALITGVLIVIVRVWFTDPMVTLSKPFGIGAEK